VASSITEKQQNKTTKYDKSEGAHAPVPSMSMMTLMSHTAVFFSHTCSSAQSTTSGHTIALMTLLSGLLDCALTKYANIN
jgi:hypothetical protein